MVTNGNRHYTLDVISFSGVEVRQMSNKEDEVMVLRMGALIV